MINMGFKVKYSFFDTAKVQRMLDKKTRQALSKAGAFIRRDAQQSMRSSKKSARPGEPPKTHKKKFLRKFLYFAYDERNKSVVIGPVLLQRTRTDKIPRLMEGGGTRVMMRDRTLRHMRYHPHPYMRPAFDKNISKIPGLFGVNIPS